MRELVWEWLLADGSTVRATLDQRRDEESVWVGRRLVSRAAIGTKPDGHRISASPYRDIDARVVFDPDADMVDRRCSLRRGDDVVTARTWPGHSRERLRRAVVTALPIALCSCVVLSGALFAAFVVGSRLATEHVDRVAGPLSEAPAVGTSTAPQIVPVPRTARRPIFRSPPAVPTIVPAAPAVVVARPRPPAPSLPAFLSPPPSPRTTFVSAPRTVPPTMTVDVVCDAQGACQGVKPVRLSMTR